MMANRLRAFWLAGVCLAAAGCQPLGYYGQAVVGQLTLITGRRPIAAVIADAETSDDLRRQLERVEGIRRFAAQRLHLPADRTYRTYVDLERAYVVWNVFAAPEFSTTAKTWCYPMVGCLAYRGYFDQAAARRYADTLARRGLDVYVAGVPAYSTLGWFDDPVLNTFIHYPAADLAGLIFHELAHRLLYVPGDTVFNESFAVAVETEGLRRWLEKRGDSAALAARERKRAYQRQFVELVLEYRDRLEELYLRKDLSTEDMRAAKRAAATGLRAAYEQMKIGWGGWAGYDRWFRGPLNNAQVGTVATYHELEGAFLRLLAEENGNLHRFFTRCRQLADLPRDRRHARLRALQ